MNTIALENKKIAKKPIKKTSKKKLSPYQQQKAINEIAELVNAGMTRRYLFDMLFRENDTNNRQYLSVL